jgi:hypothetical protein
MERVGGDQSPGKKSKPKRNNRQPVITRKDTGLRCHCKFSGLRVTLVFVCYEPASSSDRGLAR